jgi:iron complex outermembrane recepter protein
MKKNFLLLIFFVFAVTSIYGQQPKSTISGTVTSSDGLPLAGASVIAEELQTGVVAGNSGHYELRGLKAGTYHLRFSYTGYEPVVKEVILNRNEVINVSLAGSVVMTGEVVVSSTRAGNSTPVTYSNVDAVRIQRNDMTRDMPYLLALTPSVVETSDAGTGVGYTSLRVRGSGGNRINVTLDGIPLNDAESQEMFWVDLPDLASSVSSVQVQRGVGTSTNGAGAFGASVNINTLTPSNDPGAEINFSAGSFNTFKTTVKACTGRLGDHFSMALRASMIKSDGYIRHGASDIKSASISTAWSGARTIIRANALLGTERTGIAWWGVPQEILATDRRYNPAGEYTDANGVTRYYNDEVDDYLQNHYHLSVNHMITGKLSLNAALHLTTGKGYYEEQKSDQKLAEYGMGDITIGDSTITETNMVERKWMSNMFYGAVWSLTRKGTTTNLTLGGGINRYDGDHFGKILWMQNTGPYIPGYEWYRNRGLKDEINLYGKAATELTGSLSSYLDMQVRYISYSIKGPDDDRRDLTQNHYFTFFNPKAGLFWRDGSGSEAYFSVAVAHREPTRSDFTDATGDASATPRAEKMTDIETGYSFTSAPLVFNLNLYYMNYHDQLVPTGQISNVGYSIMTNVSKSYRTGIELSAKYKPSKKYGVNGSLTLSRNKISDFRNYYTEYNTSNWSSSYVYSNLGSVDIAYSPSVTGIAEMEYAPLSGLSLRLTGKYVGRQYYDNTMSNERIIDPYFISNFSADYTVKTKSSGEIGFRFQVNNLLDHKYESNAYGGMWKEDGVEKTWAYFFPQAGTNYMLSVNLKF